MKFSYYPGCSLHATGREYDESLKAVARAFGIDLFEVDDWSCCGASSAHMTNRNLSVALPARNLVAAEKAGRELMVPCAACFNRLRAAQHELAADAGLKGEVEAAVGGKYGGGPEVRNPIDIFAADVGLDRIRDVVKRPLAGLRPVAYYGCLLVRPREVCGFEDPENPVLLDRLMASLGAEAKPWSFKTDCCGGSFTISKTGAVVRLVDRLMRMAREAGANCVVTACPVCMANLDLRASESLRLPVFYFTELMALALGLRGTDGWFAGHNVDPRPLLRAAHL
ncbi:MAG: CoB--CoM heterodisulfide reductase iron-sulfur subunit B family protein [Deltaproteobacteria bacterium]|nr:CoB--CoM heterodisulfide reductase iron-sulfur subunit B family protein [Deltaproteobacteria bacterium]